ncbi:MAG: glutamine synthetase III [Clostridia bacterium]|nr:glutamine synthetase III [Clostridia bacterium]
MINVPEIFGTLVFDSKVMQERLPKEVYQALKDTVRNSAPLDSSLATTIANAMKDWAIELGATHYTHWFQPMTGITAEKHDSFMTPLKNGTAIMEFSGKELIKGEPDASSFPSGGLRATFEARGYTAWDPSSYAFVKDSTLYIPTVFCSFNGEALDKKTPLLRSLDTVSKEAVRILKLFGKDVHRVIPQVGAEQEYFLVDRKLYDRRKDLIFTGRTLLGAKPPKGQEMDDHYFGSIKTRVANYMRDLDVELWKLGVSAKTKHNEAAPAQHELAPIFNSANMAADHNQLVMETMKRVAEKHDLVCLLHEKPFAGVNGSGKHNNWSLAPETGENLLKPGASPQENAQFLLFLCAVIKAVDEHQDLLRICVSGAGNDHRLGGDEAPPAIVSIFLGEELTDILEAIERGESYQGTHKKQLEIGVDLLPKFSLDSTDRNRTSPFAFTGNKFEFRMPGSSLSIAGVNMVINTIVADALRQFADRLEGADDFQKELNKLIRETITKHKRIIFNGNNYSQEWVKEAQKRGLSNLLRTPDCVPLYTSEKNVALFEGHHVLSRVELEARCEILLENYVKTLRIEARTLLEMVKRDVLPATITAADRLAVAIEHKKQLGADLDYSMELALLRNFTKLNKNLYAEVSNLQRAMEKAKEQDGIITTSRFYADQVVPTMGRIRKLADELETITPSELWPFPTYSELLFTV